jgi:hypothetical protein
MAADVSLLQSLQPLALLAVRAADADGYAICCLDPASGRRTQKLSCGVPVPELSADSKPGALSVAEFPLRVDHTVTGILSFVFRRETISAQTRALLERVAGQVEAIWRFADLPKACAALAARIGELEVELADSKIADRARGLLANDSPAQAALDIVERHVETVLRASQLTKMLEEISRELEEKVAERKLITQAKAVLQSLHGLSEEEAHVRLQAISRKTRKPVKEVARELSHSPTSLVTPEEPRANQNADEKVWPV